ncbi:MAG: hypothetical protein M1838_004281 [Thelocarpon superellum]|nr:MAG: hypothetical protein M1838_004281 [Thelocarpon superellum]
MAAPKVFITGATGYIGGDVLYTIINAHPEYEIACLVRDSDRGALVASQYPKVRLVYGALESVEIVEEEATKADIVLNCANADNLAAAKAIAAGLSKRSETGYWIHTSGTGVLTFADMDRGTFGEGKSTKVYDDWDGVTEVTSVPDSALHRNVDQVVLASGQSLKGPLKTAIVCPPTIYGQGRGPANQRSIQLPDLIRLTLERGQAFQVGQGQTYWNEVHVRDLSKVYLALVEDAVAGAGEATWGPKGYYFAEHGEIVWGDVSKKVASVAHHKGFIKDDRVVSVTAEEASQLRHGGPVLWGANSRCSAIRARKLLRWLPTEKHLVDEIDLAVEMEAERAGLKPGHAIKAAG